MRMDMCRMMAAGLEDIDPQAVELELAPAQVEGAFLGEARDMAVELLAQIGEDRVADRQVVERGIACLLYTSPSPRDS